MATGACGGGGPPPRATTDEADRQKDDGRPARERHVLNVGVALGQGVAILRPQDVRHRGGVTAAAGLQELGADADGDLARRFGLDVQADRRVDAQQVVDGQRPRRAAA